MHSNYNILENYNSQKIQNSYNSPTPKPTNIGQELQCEQNCIPVGDHNPYEPACPVNCPCIIDYTVDRVPGPEDTYLGWRQHADGTWERQYLYANARAGTCLVPPQLPVAIAGAAAGNREAGWAKAMIVFLDDCNVGDLDAQGVSGCAGLTIAGSANAICSNFKDEFVYWQNQYQTIMSQGWQPELNASVGLPSTGGVNKMCLLHQEGGAQTASCDGLDKQIFLQTARLNMAFARDNFQQCTRMVRDKSPVCSKPGVVPLLCTTDRDSSLNLVQQSGTGGTQIALKTDDIKKIADGGNRPVATINKEHGWWGVPPLSGPATTAAPNQSRASINNYGGGILLPSAVRSCHK